MTGKRSQGNPGEIKKAPSREDHPEGQGSEDLEAARLPPKASGDADTLVGVDSPDDVDLYRHNGPPPGFGRATLGRGRPRCHHPTARDAEDERLRRG